MPEKSLYFTKALQCKVIKSLVIYWIKVRELWVLYERVLRHFSVFPRIHAPILPDKLQKITKCFQCGYKTKTKLKHRTHYAIFQNRRICASCLIVWLGVLCGLCILPYIHGLRLALVGECGLSCCFMRYWLVWALSAWERERVWRYCVFVSVDVKYIIHYRRICKFICTL